MNHIKKLQQDNADLREALKQFDKDSAQFMTFLGSAKFTGTEAGERKDWIATNDVVNRLKEMRMAAFARVNP